MKKSVLALAALGAFAGAASAQSSVTLYGRLDTAVTWADPGSNGSVAGGGAGDAVFRLNGHNPIGGSRWGMRGSEDLGGGLKANFVLESGFNSDTGAAGSPTKFFDRLAWVGLSSASLGDLKFGRQDTLTRQTNLGFSDITGEGELTVVDTVATNRPLFQNFASRVDNSIGYTTPSFGGFRVQALVGLGETTAARHQGIQASFASGPIKAAVAYEMYVDGPVDDDYNKVLTVGGSYDLGVATVLLGYQDTTDFGSQTALTLVGGQRVDHNAYNVGVLVPLSPALQLRAQYTDSTIETAGGDIDQQKYGVSLRYALSKRTTLYGVYVKRDGDGDETFAKVNEVVFGIGHNF